MKNIPVRIFMEQITNEKKIGVNLSVSMPCVPVAPSEKIFFSIPNGKEEWNNAY